MGAGSEVLGDEVLIADVMGERFEKKWLMQLSLFPKKKSESTGARARRRYLHQYPTPPLPIPSRPPLGAAPPADARQRSGHSHTTLHPARAAGQWESTFETIDEWVPPPPEEAWDEEDDDEVKWKAELAKNENDG